MTRAALLAVLVVTLAGCALGVAVRGPFDLGASACAALGRAGCAGTVAAEAIVAEAHGGELSRTAGDVLAPVSRLLLRLFGGGAAAPVAALPVVPPWLPEAAP